MKGLKRRVEKLEQAKGQDVVAIVGIERTDDGRVIFGGEVYDNVEALRTAKGFPPWVYFASWMTTVPAPGEEPCPREETAGIYHPDKQETPQDHTDSVEGIVDDPAPEITVYNPFMPQPIPRPIPEHLMPRQTHAIMPKSLFGPNSVFGDKAAAYWRR